jgi:hypothetical protein
MPEQFADFEWPIAPKGYRWRGRVGPFGVHRLNSPSDVEAAWQRLEKQGSGTGPILQPIDLESGRYHPMQRAHATLFRTFAELNYKDRNAIQNFANQYGQLGLARMGIALKRHGESHLSWAREICRLRTALKLAQPRTKERNAGEQEAWRAYGLDPGIPSRRRREELEFYVNAYLAHVHDRMTFAQDGPPRRFSEPDSLLAAMWLQFALAAAEDKRFLSCKFCGRLMEISTETTGFRRHRLFCSGTCKTKDYRRRRQLALAASDSSVPDIANNTKTDPATIKKWLAELSREEGKT